MKHLKKHPDGIYRYRPPYRAIKAGVVSQWEESDGRRALPRAERDNRLINQWRKGEISGAVILPGASLAEIAAHYMSTAHYQSLSRSTKKSYKYLFGKISDSFGDISIEKINVARCERVYQDWIDDSIPNAKMLVRALSILYRHAMAHELVPRNPMVFVKKVTHRPKVVIWAKDQVEKFIDTAFSKWEWRNIGMLVLMCYEYAQRPIDVARLKWEHIDFDKNQITINQSKRGATVYVPMDEYMRDLLRQQHDDFSFQEWVLPQLRSIDGAYRHYNNEQFARIAREIMDHCGLSEELKIGKLRNTAITEMVEAGVDSTGIMQVSGHADISSLNPYLKNTLKGATMALSKRKQQ